MGRSGWVRGTSMAERDAKQEAARRGITIDGVWAERAASYPAGRVLSPADVAGVVSFLVSDSASSISGEAITVSLGVRKPFQHDDAAAFTAYISVCRRIERFAPPVGRHHSGLGKRQRKFGA